MELRLRSRAEGGGTNYTEMKFPSFPWKSQQYDDDSSLTNFHIWKDAVECANGAKIGA